jgi:hypothetical protein
MRDYTDLRGGEVRSINGMRYFRGGAGVGVIVLYCGRYLRSMASRILATLAPAPCICIASRATSRQMPHVMP